MATDRSDKLHADWRASTEKFDYFMLGALGALCAFIGQGYKPSKLGLNPTSMELIALLALVSAVIFGFWRIEQCLLITSLNHKELYANETRGGMAAKMNDGLLVINEATGETFDKVQAAKRVAELTEIIHRTRQALEAAISEALKHYRWRNGLALTGFSLFILARIWSAYV